MLSNANISRISSTKPFRYIEGNWQINVRTYQNAPAYKCVFYHSRDMSSPTHHEDQNRLLVPVRKVLLFPLIVLEDPLSVYSYIGCPPSSSWSQRSRGLRRVCGRSPGDIVGSNPAGGMDVCCECCVLSDRGLCDELITRPEEFYGLWCVVVGYLETSRMRKPWPALGRSDTTKKIPFLISTK